ncbi:MAG: DeoR/GlpR family DNA-binding transcription regulator [Pseudomonadota bacterium]
MLTERQREIIAIAVAETGVGVDDLAARFEVTPQTIRRDLNALCDRGLLARTHGGARPINSVSNVEYEDRHTAYADEKRRIGMAAASLISPRTSLIINIGTTTEQVARAIYDHHDLVVITNNINVVNILSGSPAKELILAGGVVRQTDGGVVGEAAVEFIRQFRADLAVIGASAVEEDGAVLDFDYREVSVARAIIENARRVMLVFDHSKFERRATVRICEIDQIDLIVTDREPSARFRARCERDGVEIVVADETPSAQAQPVMGALAQRP